MKKYIKFTEIFDTILHRHTEKYYKDSFRRGWYISDIVKYKNGNWIIKWERKLSSL